jgi:hypothetical protein
MGTANYDSSRLTELRRNRTISSYAQSVTTQINSAGASNYTVRKIQQPNTTGNIIAYIKEAPCGCTDSEYRRQLGQICCGGATQ